MEFVENANHLETKIEHRHREIKKEANLKNYAR